MDKIYRAHLKTHYKYPDHLITMLTAVYWKCYTKCYSLLDVKEVTIICALVLIDRNVFAGYLQHLSNSGHACIYNNCFNWLGKSTPALCSFILLWL